MRKRKNKKIIYLIISLIIITSVVTYFQLKKEDNKKKEINIVQSEIQVQNKEDKIKTQSPLTPKEEYTISKNYDILPKDPKGNKKIVLLTIDDGPSSQTLEILKVLEAHKIKAIFFINGMHYKANPGTLEAEAKAGFPIGNHTWSHINLLKTKNIDLVNKEISSNNELITKITSTPPKFFRPPYGVSSVYVKDLVKKENMIYIDWSGAAKDWEKTARDQDVFIKNVTDGLHPGSIILMHEHPWSLKNLDKLLTTIEQKGYTFADPNNITE